MMTTRKRWWPHLAYNSFMSINRSAADEAYSIDGENDPITPMPKHRQRRTAVVRRVSSKHPASLELVLSDGSQLRLL